ncbi:MAG: MBOAT family protein [Planctomycetaceae bacterium]|nr:MAG: MBOAT family protein [Planctomycetaceae bacterium]
MNFAQLEYVVLLAAIVLVNLRIEFLTVRKLVLLAASYYFYSYWDVRFLGLLLFSTLLDYSVGRALQTTADPRHRRGLLGLSLAGNLGLLGFFKYYGFFVESAQPLWDAMGWHPGTLQILLPVGISFYTFQTLSYTIDVYRGRIAACRNPLDFAIYVAFFPQLVAGPIVRASEFLPQISRMLRPRPQTAYSGLAQLLRGFIKKVLIADNLAMLVDPVMAGPELYAWPTVLLALLGYAGQIYADFAGYTDIAIGSARLLGFELPENFRHPYFAHSPRDFWRRWHITLSTWLRDYVYIPLGGNRRGSSWFTFRNLMITMALGGLWHGASWNFVLWGIWHGIALGLTRGWSDHPPSDPVRHALRVATTFAIVLAGWTLFRTTDLGHFKTLWSQLLLPQSGYLWLPPLPIAALTLLTIEHLIWASRWRHLLELRPEHPATPWLVILAIAALALFAPTAFRPFVYFQF